MATWTDVPPGEVVPGAVNKSAHMQAALDNTVALAEQATGAPLLSGVPLVNGVVFAGSRSNTTYSLGDQAAGTDLRVYDVLPPNTSPWTFTDLTEGTYVFMGGIPERGEVGGSPDTVFYGLFWRIA